MTELHNQPEILEMTHSHYLTHDRLQTATEGTYDDLNGISPATLRPVG